MNVTCPSNSCEVLLNSKCVFYEGLSLVPIGVNTNDNLEVVIQKISSTIENLEEGGLGEAVWGDITGTITNQSDLILYLSNNYYPLSNPNGYVPQSRTLTINGNAQNLSANRTWTIQEGHVIENSGSPLTHRANLNFNNNLVATDDSVNNASVITLNPDLTNIDSILFNTGGSLQSGVLDTNTLLLQAYDVDGASYTTFATLTSGNTPTMDLSDTVTKNGQYIYRIGGSDILVTDGGTGLSSISQGSILYGSATNTYSELSKNTSTSRYLSNNGIDNNPAWSQIDLTNGVTGILPIANGGTGSATQNFWSNNGTTTISSTATINSNGQNRHIFGGAWTGSTGDVYHLIINPSITMQSIAGITTYAVRISPTIIATANNQTLATLDLTSTYTSGSFSGITRWGLIANAGIYLPIGSGSEAIRIQQNATGGAVGVNFYESTQRVGYIQGTGSANGTIIRALLISTDHASGQIGLRTGAGTEAGFIDSSQRWGVGTPFTATLSARLHIRGTGTGTNELIRLEDSTPNLRGVMLNNGNTGWFGANSFGSGVGVMSFLNAATPASGSITDGFIMYSNDVSAGNAAPYFRTENGNIIILYTTNEGSAYSITNGVISRSYDANSTSVEELADVLYTLIEDIKLTGLII